MKNELKYIKNNEDNFIQLLDFRKQQGLTFTDLKNLINTITETKTKEIIIKIYNDYLTAYNETYTTYEDIELIRTLFDENKESYGWTLKDLDFFLNSKYSHENQEFIDTYHHYVMEQLLEEYNGLEVSNGKYITIHEINEA